MPWVQDPVGTVLSTELPTANHHNSIRRISQSGLTHDIKMGSCVFQCDVPHQWIAQRQVGPVSVYCDGMGCHVLWLRHGISVWQPIGQNSTATSRHRRDMTSDVKPKQTKNLVWQKCKNTLDIASVVDIFEFNKIYIKITGRHGTYPGIWKTQECSCVFYLFICVLRPINSEVI